MSAHGVKSIRYALASSGLLSMLLAAPVAAEEEVAARVADPRAAETPEASEALQAPAADEAGIDPAVAVIEALHAVLLEVMKRAEELGYDGRFQQLEPAMRKHFDLAFMGDAFEHVQDPAAVVAKFADVVAPGGVVVITTVDFDSWLARLLGARWRLMTPPEHLFFWTRRSIEKIFDDHGFDARVENYWLFYPKAYVEQRSRAQFGVAPPFLGWLPGNTVPIPSFDVLLGIFQKRT